MPHNIQMTNESSAKLLGINLACYTDKQLKELSIISADAEAVMEKFDRDSTEYADAFALKYQADCLYDERWMELREAFGR
jgi:hypothetical protein